MISQKNTTVGDIEGNFRILKKSFNIACAKNCDFFLTPELSLTGYPPQDLLLRQDFIKKIEKYKKKIINLTKNRETIFSLSIPLYQDRRLVNSLLLIKSGKILHTYEKMKLPNYGVFDEKRYFNSKEKKIVLDFKKKKIDFLICEDMWSEDFENYSAKHSLDFIIIINASPFEFGKFDLRKKLAFKRAKYFNAKLIYVNLVGAQDDLIFDGGSFVMEKNGKIISQLPFFKESDYVIDFQKINRKRYIKESDLSLLYKALVTGLKNYMSKNGFKSATLGLSGGIDSALSLAIVADSIGSENISSFFLPSLFTSQRSKTDALDMSNYIGVKTQEISIEKLRKSVLSHLNPIFKDLKEEVTEENIQSRLRGLILMAVSNKFNSLLITTGNKSELAVGYSTLYGDMSGGYSILKDVYKTKVFELCNWRNENLADEFRVKKIKVIPENIITKEPSAELKFNQIDKDSLPPYHILDRILELLIDENRDLKFIIRQGFSKKLVKKIWLMVKNSEFKRYQSVIGPKVSKMALSLDRRFPLTNKFNLD